MRDWLQKCSKHCRKKRMGVQSNDAERIGF